MIFRCQFDESWKVRMNIRVHSSSMLGSNGAPTCPGGEEIRPRLTCSPSLPVGDELAVLAIEAKVKESFGQYVKDWLTEGGDNRAKRLRGLCDLLDLSTESASGLRYQLLHRTAAAVLEAKRYRARHAAMVVQSFCPDARACRISRASLRRWDTATLT
jgi:hypothetical protein